MNNLLAYQEPSYMTVQFSVVCRKNDELSFNYFINSVKNIHLKKYTIINEFNIEGLKKAFLEKAKLCSDLRIKFILKQKLQEDALGYLQQAIIRAGEARGIIVKF